MLNFRYFYMFLATVYVILSNIVFVGQNNFAKLIVFTSIVLISCLIMRKLYRVSKLLFMSFFWVYFLFVIGSFIYSIVVNGDFELIAAGYITVGFMILLSILGSGAIEIVLLFIGSISLMAGGIWMSRTQPNFDFYLTSALLIGIVLLTLSVFRIDIFNARDASRLHRDRPSDYTPIKGNFRNFSVFSTVTYIFLMTLGIATILFTLLPRPTLKSTAKETRARYESEFREEFGGVPSKNNENPPEVDENIIPETYKEAPEENDDINLRWAFLSSLLDKKPRFNVRFSRFGHEPRRMLHDDFYTKIKVFDTYWDDIWRVSKYAQNAWSSVQDQDYVFPLLLELLEAREDTRGGILANAIFNGDPDENKLSAEYKLFKDQVYSHLFVPDFPLGLELLNYRLNEYTGEIKTNAKKLSYYRFDTFNANYDRLRGMVCAKGKGKVNKRFFEVGKFDLDLYDLALKIVSDAKKDPEFTEFAANDFTDYDVIRAVIKFLKYSEGENAFRYEIAPPMVPSETGALRFFLLNSRIGNCTQFNTAAAILLRYLDIPTRVVAGYRGGKWVEDGSYYEVQYLRAHLWFEVYFKDFGWYRFDATPEAPRTKQLEDVVKDKYEIPMYDFMDFSSKIEEEKEDANPQETEKPEFEDDPDSALQVGESAKATASLNRFLTDYDNDVVIKKVVELAKFVFSSSWRTVLFVVISFLILLIFFHAKWIKAIGRWLGLLKNGKTSNGKNLKSRKSQILENKLVADFRELEKLFRKLGYVRKRSETWVEFNNRLNSSTPFISTMLNSLILTYYYARFGMNYAEFQALKEQIGTLKQHLHSQIKAKAQAT